MGQTFGDDNVACLKSRQEQQAQSALAPLTAQAIGRQQRNENPNRNEQRQMKRGEQSPAQIGFEAVVQPEK